MAKRPSLADLTAQKPSTAKIEPAAVAGSSAMAGVKGFQADGRKGVLIRFQPEGWRHFRDLAAELTLSTGQPVTMQSMIIDAVNEILKRNGRPPVA